MYYQYIEHYPSKKIDEIFEKAQSKLKAKSMSNKKKGKGKKTGGLELVEEVQDEKKNEDNTKSLAFQVQ